MIATFFVLHTIGYHCAKYEHSTQKMKEEFAIQAVTQIIFDIVYMTFTFDSKVTLVICIVRCNLQTIGNHYAKYEHH